MTATKIKKPTRSRKSPSTPMPKSTVLVLRTCTKDHKCCSGGNNHVPVTWPESGPFAATDWDSTPKCGGGLHGLLWGEGDGSLLDWSPDSIWKVLEVEAATVVVLPGEDKVKFPACEVVFSGSQKAATDYIAANGGQGKAIVGYTATAGCRGTATAGDRGTATAGDSGTATAGYSGTATAGYSGTATAGDSGTATAGYSGTATAGDRGTATAGDSGTATAGDRGTATAGDSGTATAGDSGTATAGYSGTATAGDRGTATAGDRGTATAGDKGILIFRYYDSVNNRWRATIGYVGEDGIKAGIAYRLDGSRIVAVECEANP